MIKSSFFGDKGFSLSECVGIESFSGYLETVRDKRIHVFTDGGYYDIPYKTRWSESYKKKMLAKMYGVEDYFRSSGCSVVTLLTLTGYQGGEYSRGVKGEVTTREDLFENIKGGWRLLSNLLVKEYPALKNVWVMEPHKSGYPHMHVAVLGYISPSMRERLTRLWSEKYAVGSLEHGIDFSVKSVKESVQSIKNYLMKYITKGIGAGGVDRWTAEEWLYHAIAWKHCHRYIGMSRSISRYCTAYRLRYGYRKYMRDLTDGKYDPGMPDIPVDKDGLDEVIQRFKWKASIYMPEPEEKRWSCTFMNSGGTVSLVRKSENFGTCISQDAVAWVNGVLGVAAGYADDFLRIAPTKWTLGLEKSEQTTIV
jgi:hypothetical protein